MATTQPDFQPFAQGTPLYTIPDGSIASIARQYPYRKLDGRTKIRLFKLFPESHESLTSKVLGRKLHATSLYGTLIEVDLAGQPSYECLSYTWGQSDSSRVLWLDENIIPISDNLDLALRSLQLEDQPRLLWVDFVCINQMDLDERKNQVQLMHEIFSNAKKVVAYLGYEADGSEKIPELLARICSASDLASKDVKIKRFHCTPWALALYGLPPSGDKLWEALRKFLCRPWFFRAWILHEALAARKLDMLCGTWVVSADFIFMSLIFSIGHRLPNLSFSLEHNMPWEQPNIRGCAQVALMHELGINKWMFESLEQEPKQWSLVEVLERSRYTSSSDPRDRVFALLNLCKEGKDGKFLPDYTETVRETFIRTAKFLINSGQGAKVLLNAFLSDPSLKLPSWVPDWSFTNFPSENPAPWATAYKIDAIPSAGGPVLDMHLGKQQNHLCVIAFRICEIQSLSCVRKNRHNRHFGMIDAINEALQSLYKCQSHEHTEDQKCHSSSHSATAKLTAVHYLYILGTYVIRMITLFGVVATVLMYFRIDFGMLENSEFQSASIEASQESKKKDKEKNVQSNLEDRSDWPPLYLIVEEISNSLKQSPKYAEQDYSNVIWRTLICSDQLKSIKEAHKDYNDAYESFVDITKCQYEPGYLIQKVKRVITIVESEPVSNDINQDEDDILTPFLRHFRDMNLGAEKFNSEARRFCFHMRIATTKTGYIGMVPQQAQEGDTVIVIKGVSVPMIIRRAKLKEESFILVGQAYFYGFMHGEVISNNGEFKEETITLV
jgi:heterokaryon incompatibility protein (HET)